MEAKPAWAAAIVVFFAAMDAKNSALPVAGTISSRGRLLDLSRPVVMGILNAAPDSFFAPSRVRSAAETTDAAATMLEAGATLIDAGGASSRPGAKPVSTLEEADRLLPLIDALVNTFPDVWLSVDTTSASIAQQALQAGASIINDISAGTFDENMLAVVAASKAPYIIMHMQGKPKTMQDAPHYKNVTLDVLDYLIARMQACRAAGIQDIILDPGFGFGKTTAHNFELLRNMDTLRMAGCPLLAGVSRKRMICETLGVKAAAALNGTTAVHMIALQKGASILRVHDVREAVEAIRIFEACYAC